jgi:hypothetical protein
MMMSEQWNFPYASKIAVDPRYAEQVFRPGSDRAGSQALLDTAPHPSQKRPCHACMRVCFLVPVFIF